MIKITFTILFFLLLISCERSFSPIVNDSQDEILFAPDKDLSVAKILQLQKISTIHFVQWDSVIVNDNIPTEAHIGYELFLDNQHLKTIQFFPDNEPWIQTIIDLENWDVWQYNLKSNTFIELSFPDTLLAFELISKRYIASKLYSECESVRFDLFYDNKCHVVSDSLGNIEWIWVNHGLPIKWQITNEYDGLTVEVNRELREIDINLVFPDSLFIRPSNK